MDQPKFAIGEIVILQSKRFPELNGKYPVVDVLAPGESTLVDGVLMVNSQSRFGYSLGVRAVGHSGWWCESALRKRHQPGEYSWQDLKTILHLPVSRTELARLDKEVAHA
ncbi:MAG: hypothetical protein ACLGID_00310 [Gammaproteobacteria bacterium]